LSLRKRNSISGSTPNLSPIGTDSLLSIHAVKKTAPQKNNLIIQTISKDKKGMENPFIKRTFFSK